MENFEFPDFAKHGQVEVRIDNDGGISIYCNDLGLNKFIQHCQQLLSKEKNRSTSHIHLEDFDLLTANSKRLTVAVFREKQD